jgi:hypothetical protein
MLKQDSKSPSASDITADVELSGHETVRPMPDILDALEQDYPLEASIADLVDNSIDAAIEAAPVNVLVRFVRNGARLVSLCVVDDGKGMTEKDITAAMQFAARRKYGRQDLGMFGVGLKTASLSQAESVIVASRASGRRAVARRWTRSGIKERDWSLDILTGGSAARLFQHDWGFKAHASGTIVRWDNVYDFERLHRHVDEYLESAIRRIQIHLGLKLHRFIAKRKVRIRIDVEDVKEGVGPPSEVLPLNPLPPQGKSGASGYPKIFRAQLPGVGVLRVKAHLWRKNSRDEGYKLGGGRVAEHQGFYFYRHDRLIQDGGWSGIIGTNEPHMSLARVEVDIPDPMTRYLKIRSNKAGIDAPATFGPALYDATASDGTRFSTYLEKAEEVYRRKGAVRARPMLPPGDGIPAEVRNALVRSGATFTRGHECTVSWEKVRSAALVHMDLNEKKIALNSRYRKMLLRGRHGGKTDLPLVRTLLYFMFEPLLSGDRIGPVERRRLEAMYASMNAALLLERKWADEE